MEGNANSGPFCWYVSNIPFPSDVYYYVSVNIILLLFTILLITITIIIISKVCQFFRKCEWRGEGGSHSS